jgi:thiosulfate/3-mercaptopyruvate sulfurtransferase
VESVSVDSDWVASHWPSGATEDVGRAGHIPGAVPIPVSVLSGEDGAPADRDRLRALFETAGVTRDKRVVAYCTIGNGASQVAAVLRHDLGYPDVAIYFGPWADWVHQPDTPVES